MQRGVQGGSVKGAEKDFLVVPRSRGRRARGGWTG